MAGSKEIRNKIKSVQSTRKITKAMEMVAASKMKKAQERMRASRPYLAARASTSSIHVAKANTEYQHPFLHKREHVKRVGAIVVTTDKGLCGGLNTNVLRLMLQKHKEWTAAGLGVDYVALGSRGPGVPDADGRQRRRERRAARRPAAPRPRRRPGKVAARQVHRRRHRRSVCVLHVVHQHDEAGGRVGGRIVPVPMQYRALGGPATSSSRRRAQARGTTSTSRTRARCSTA